jgi:hypothetical protein
MGNDDVVNKTRDEMTRNMGNGTNRATIHT